MKTVLHKSSIPENKIFLVKYLDDSYFDPTWHSHSEYQLFLVEEGTGTRFIGDTIKSFHPGELVFTGPNLPHLWRSDEVYFQKGTALRSVGIVIYFNEHFFGENTLDKEEFIGIKKLLLKSMRGLEFYGAKKEQAILHMRALLKLRGMDAVIQLLKLLSMLASGREYNYISPFTYESLLNETETDRTNIVYDFILKNFKNTVTLDHLAALLHMTATSFSRYFSMINNKSFSRFIMEIRVKHACKMLIETDVTVANVCYESGFNTLSNFNNQFKQVMQKTPVEYRKEYLRL